MTTPVSISPSPGYTPVAKDYLQHPYAGEKLIGVVEVNRPYDYYITKDKTKRRNKNVLSADEGAVARFNRTKSKTYYTVEDNSAETFVGTRTENEANVQDWSEVQDAVQDMTGVVMNRAEKKKAILLGTDGNYDAARLMTPGVLWTAGGAGTPLADIYQIIGNLGPFMPNDMMLNIGFGKTAWDIFAVHSTVLDAIKYSGTGGRCSPEEAKRVLSKFYPVDNLEILLPELETDAGTVSKIWNAKDVFITVTPRGTPSKNKQCGAATFRQKVVGEPIAVYITPSSEGAHNGQMVKVSLTEVSQIVNKEYLGRVKGAVA